MRKGRKQLGLELLSRIGFPVRTYLSGAKLTKHFSRRVQVSEASEEPWQDMGVRDSLKIQNSELRSDAVTEVAVRRSRVTRRYRKERDLSGFIRAWKTPQRCDIKKPGRAEASSPAWKKFLRVKQLWRSEVEGEKTGTPSRSRLLTTLLSAFVFFPSVVSQVGLRLLSRISRALRYYSLQGTFICWKAKVLFLRRLNNTGPGNRAFFFSACLVLYKKSQSTGHVLSRKSIKLLTMK